ncbi:MAG: hypothetical protein WA919_15645 [Coleofasciculaceae cyanobacterium]
MADLPHIVAAIAKRVCSKALLFETLCERASFGKQSIALSVAEGGRCLKR